MDRAAGFKTCSIPDLSVDTSEYREGVYKYTRKFPGVPKVGECSLTKGVAKKDSDFQKWLFTCINGGATYRTDIDILEYHIKDEWGIDGHPSKVIHLREVFPSSVKLTGDKDASSSDVAIQEITLMCEEVSAELIQT